MKNGAKQMLRKHNPTYRKTLVEKVHPQAPSKYNGGTKLYHIKSNPKLIGTVEGRSLDKGSTQRSLPSGQQKVVPERKNFR